MHRVVAATAMVLLFTALRPAAGGVQGGAGDSSAQDLARALQQKYDGIRDFSADFVHSYRGGVLGKEIAGRRPQTSSELAAVILEGFKADGEVSSATRGRPSKKQSAATTPVTLEKLAKGIPPQGRTLRPARLHARKVAGRHRDPPGLGLGR